MKKFLISCLILLIFGLAVLIIGWGQFSIPAGSYAVMVTKTGGVNPNVIEPGKFSWYWERLIPTNVSMRVFSITPVSTTTTITGSLPSADIYSPMLEGSPDFSYNFTVETQILMKSNYLPTFVKQTNAQNNTELQEYLTQKSELLAKDAIQFLLDSSISTSENLVLLSTNTQAILDGINANKNYSNLEISDITIKTVHMPDTQLYNVAKSTYIDFQNKVKQSLTKLTDNQSAVTAQDYLQIERFARWGKILQDYPILIDFLAVSREDASSAIGALDILKNRKAQ